ncbi:MAG: hypothetical protein UMR38_00715 [Candidatus Izemoplasma sp.]|nr:hypothetical protein [Candidatus Izemoplasma sp.]
MLDILLSPDYIIFTIIGVIISYFIVKKLFKNMLYYAIVKRFVNKSKRLRKKKYNGLMLVEYTKQKRKKNTNSYKKLKRRAKRKVKKYFIYKIDELPRIVKYTQSKLLKKSRKRLTIIIKNERKTVKKFYLTIGVKPILQLTDTYQCLDEMIQFFHHLPDAILADKDYDIFLDHEGILITYKIS